MRKKKIDNKKLLRNFVKEGRFKLESLAYRHMDTILIDRETLEAAVDHVERLLKARSVAGIAARGKSGRPVEKPDDPKAEANRRRVRNFYNKRKAAAV